MIGYVGDDIFADNNISSLAKNGVDVSLIKKLENMATGVASINVTSDGF